MSDIVQVALRGAHKAFFLNSRNLWLKLRKHGISDSEREE